MAETFTTYLRRAAVVVAPLRIARGIQNKVLEGLAMGVPVVATSIAVQGVNGVAQRDYLVADDAVFKIRKKTCVLDMEALRPHARISIIL